MKEFHIVLSTNERYMPGAMVARAEIALNAKLETALLRIGVVCESVVV